MGAQVTNSSIKGDAVEEQVNDQNVKDVESRLARIRMLAFKVVAVLNTLFVLAMFNLVLLMVVLSWLPAETYLGIIGEPAAELIPHRLHDSINPVLAWSLLIGVGIQLRRPRARQAPLLMVLAVPIAFTVVELATGTFAVMENVPLYVAFGLLALLHPGLRESLRIRRLDKLMAGLTGAAAAAWLPFAYQQAQLQSMGIAADAHAAKEHWARMAAFALLVVVWGLLGSSDRPGWRITAWVTGLASAWYGLQSLIFGGASSAALPWAIGAVVWGAAFIVAAERRARSSRKVTAEGGDSGASRAIQA